VDLLAEAGRCGLSTAALHRCLAAELAGDPLAAPDGSRVTALIEALVRLDGPAGSRVRAGVEAFAARLRAAAAGPIAVVSDPDAGCTRMWWGAGAPAAGADPGAGEVVLAVLRADEGEPGRLSVLVRPVADPEPDFRKALTARAVGQALDRVRREPGDPALLAAAVTALSRTPVTGGAEWVLAGTAPLPTDLPALGGTVAVVGSAVARIGGRTVRRSSVLHTVSPSAAAAMLLADGPQLVDALVDLVVAPVQQGGDPAAGAAFLAGLAAARPPDLAASAAARRAGTVHRAPEVGTTVRITADPGAGPARRAAAKSGRVFDPTA
jgi:hypothetical protein